MGRKEAKKFENEIKDIAKQEEFREPFTILVSLKDPKTKIEVEHEVQEIIFEFWNKHGVDLVDYPNTVEEYKEWSVRCARCGEKLKSTSIDAIKHFIKDHNFQYNLSDIYGEKE